MGTQECPYCHATFPSNFQNCFDYFTIVSSIENSDVRFRKYNSYTVDAHALQHPELHGLKNNFYHLLSLCYSLEFIQSSILGEDIKFLQERVNSTKNIPNFDPPKDRGSLTINYISKTSDPAQYGNYAKDWAETVWNTWSNYHAEIRKEIRSLLSKKKK
ncbi:MAG: DUF5946 family protein [Candidatus Hodarchaeales archaeon]|jgi:hypothetical protein